MQHTVFLYTRDFKFGTEKNTGTFEIDVGKSFLATVEVSLDLIGLLGMKITDSW